MKTLNIEHYVKKLGGVFLQYVLKVLELFTGFHKKGTSYNIKKWRAKTVTSLHAIFNII